MSELEIWTYTDIAEHLVKLATSTGEEYDEARKEFDAMSVQYCFGMMAHVRKRDAEIATLKGMLKPNEE